MSQGTHRVAIVGVAGHRELLSDIHTEDVHEIDVYMIGKWCIVYDIVDLTKIHLQDVYHTVDMTSTELEDIYTNAVPYRRDRTSAVVFVVQQDTDVRNYLLREVCALKTADFDLSRAIVFGPSPVAKRIAGELSLGHYVSQADILRDLLLAIINDTRSRDTIVLSQTTGAGSSQRSPRRAWC